MWTGSNFSTHFISTISSFRQRSRRDRPREARSVCRRLAIGLVFNMQPGVIELVEHAGSICAFKCTRSKGTVNTKSAVDNDVTRFVGPAHRRIDLCVLGVLYGGSGGLQALRQNKRRR